MISESILVLVTLCHSPATIMWVESRSRKEAKKYVLVRNTLHLDWVGPDQFVEILFVVRVRQNIKIIFMF